MSLFTKWAFKNKAAVGLMSVLVLLMGLISYFTLPMEFLPPADEPLVMVVAMGQGTDAKTMETQVTTPIENTVAGVKGKKNIFSTTGDGFTKIDINFDSKTDMKQAKQDVAEAVSSLQLPPNIMKPTIVQRNTSMIPIADVAVNFKDGLTTENLKFAKQKIIDPLKSIKGVAAIQTYGSSDSFVSVKVDNALLAQKKVSLQSLMGVLQGQNVSVAIGEKNIDGKASNISVVGNINSISKLESLTVAPGVSLKDVASVNVKKPEGMMTRVDGNDSLLLIVVKDSNSNAVSVSKDLSKKIKELNKKYDQAEAKILIATADMVKTSVNSMMKEVLIGALFATIVIMVFLRNIRSTFITIVSIPLSLAFTLFLLSKSGVTLNILTLGGVAVAVGRLVDDSIVVIENIFRKMQNEKFSVHLVLDATKEVSSAITASTLTTVAVFLPIGLVNGGLQDFVLPFALTITYSLLSSLVVALTVVPLMSSALLKNAKLREHKPSVKFTRFITWSLNHKWVVILVSFLLFAGSIGTYFSMPKGATDNSSADFVQVVLNYPSDTPVEKVKENTLELEKFITGLNEVKNEFTTLGISEDAAKFGDVGSPTVANLNIILKNKDETDGVIKKINSQKDKYPGATLTAAASSMMGGGSPQINIDVMGEDLASIEKTAKSVETKIRNIKGIEKISSNQESKKTVYSLDVELSKGNTQQIAQQVGVMLNRTPIGSMELDGQKTMVLLDPILDPKTPDDLSKITVMTQAGMVPVSSVATLNKEEKPSSAFHKDGDAYIQITAMVKADKLSQVTEEMNKRIFGNKKDVKGMKLPSDVNVFVGGASQQQADDFNDLFTTMAISIGLVFLIMVITFKTIRAPIAILFSLPLAAIGAIFALLISRIAVDITGLLGALMLIGVVVTNAIVLLDRIKQNEEKMIMRDAIVEAASIRMRPILMTAIATIFAMLPLLFKKAETGNLVSQSLAIVVIGGLSAATLLTLVVIPVVYELLHFRKSKKQRLSQSSHNHISM
ncbi:efflux RND transporter permease subunit [Neobacillus terrae]|uniref:efflux RND transporter permease subunit n=1 Tax=Neobacillus terrae TaxID=3034837 RepID=UPI00140DB962|nr:efflux RND transporter permease subunit [Neobacillus terrae]NHM31840.1 efflux RND transporter permease subunit [Neobacillus terrae]